MTTYILIHFLSVIVIFGVITEITVVEHKTSNAFVGGLLIILAPFCILYFLGKIIGRQFKL